MLELAGQTYFDRGEDYHSGGHVYDLVEHGEVVVAKVVGTADYRVRLWVEDGLAYSWLRGDASLLPFVSEGGE